MEVATKTNITEGLAKEREFFMDCFMSPQAAAFQHLFFAERQAAKIKGLPKDTALREINSVGIIGAGLMGGGIAMNFVNVGIPVVLLDVNEAGLQKGLSVLEGNYARTVKKGRLSEADMQKRLSLISGTTDYNDLGNVDLVIEAVFENLELKKTIFKQLDQICKSGAILASNTSYQDIDAIAAVTNRPQDVCGMHFFSPANVMKLLEVVRADKTSDDVVATAMAVGKRIRKISVLAGVCYGFIGNRIFNNYMREAQLCLLEGASPEQIDNALQSWGMAMGSLAVADLAGLDIGYNARQSLPEELRGDPKVSAVTDQLAQQGHIGQKSGRGIYVYDPETRSRNENPDLAAMVTAAAEQYGVTRRDISDEEIIDRHVLALVNEGARVLEEGIAQRPSDIDITYIYGYGFAPFRGGPMHYADHLGIKNVYARICEFHEQLGDDWAPAPLIKQLAESGQSFAQWAQSQ